MILYFWTILSITKIFLECIDLTVQKTISGADVTTGIIEIIHGIGRKMCERECILRQNECQSITYDLEHFVCRLQDSFSSSGWSLGDNYRVVNVSEFSKKKKMRKSERIVTVTTGKCANVECLPNGKCVEMDMSARCIQIGFPRDCKDIYKNVGQKSGLYVTYPYLPNTTKVVSVCDMDHEQGGYTIIQRRLDGSVNFSRNWEEYANGFGNLESEFWIVWECVRLAVGLARGLVGDLFLTLLHLNPPIDGATTAKRNNLLHTMTNMNSTLLYIKLQSHRNEWKYAEYTSFYVADSQDNYRITFSYGSGTAGNSLSNCNNAQFSTYERDHDISSSNCVDIRGKGGWWFNSCCLSNLNGIYCASGEDDVNKCNRWHYFSNNGMGMKTSILLIRRID